MMNDTVLLGIDISRNITVSIFYHEKISYHQFGFGNGIPVMSEDLKNPHGWMVNLWDMYWKGYETDDPAFKEIQNKKYYPGYMTTMAETIQKRVFALVGEEVSVQCVLSVATLDQTYMKLVRDCFEKIGFEVLNVVNSTVAATAYVCRKLEENGSKPLLGFHTFFGISLENIFCIDIQYVNQELTVFSEERYIEDVNDRLESGEMNAVNTFLDHDNIYHLKNQYRQLEDTASRGALNLAMGSVVITTHQFLS